MSDSTNLDAVHSKIQVLGVSAQCPTFKAALGVAWHGSSAKRRFLFKTFVSNGPMSWLNNAGGNIGFNIREREGVLVPVLVRPARPTGQLRESLNISTSNLLKGGMEEAELLLSTPCTTKAEAFERIEAAASLVRNTREAVAGLEGVAGSKAQVIYTSGNILALIGARNWVFPVALNLLDAKVFEVTDESGKSRGTMSQWQAGELKATSPESNVGDASFDEVVPF